MLRRHVPGPESKEAEGPQVPQIPVLASYGDCVAVVLQGKLHHGTIGNAWQVALHTRGEPPHRSAGP